jgi:hypothetical protein
MAMLGRFATASKHKKIVSLLGKDTPVLYFIAIKKHMKLPFGVCHASTHV